MKIALKSALAAGVGVVALALPTLAHVQDHCPNVACKVPEPATLLLLVGGLATVIGAHKLRKN